MESPSESPQDATGPGAFLTIFRHVEAIASDGSRVTGVVTEVVFTDSEPLLIVEDTPVTLDNVLRVFAQEPEIQ